MRKVYRLLARLALDVHVPTLAATVRRRGWHGPDVLAGEHPLIVPSAYPRLSGRWR